MRLRGPIAPMLAKPVDRFPTAPPGVYVFEPKMDGFRCLAIVDADRGVHLQSRHGTRFNDAFPEVMWAVYDGLPAATVVDGEIVRWSPAGRLDFTALEARCVARRHVAEQLARIQPCHYVVFDVLCVRGHDVTAKPLSERRKLLEELFATVPAAGVLALSMQTADEDEARTWYRSLHTAGIEGLVIKPSGSPYEPSVRGWLKLKYRSTTEAIVGGVTGSLQRPDELLLGRYDGSGRLHVIGRTTPLSAEAAARIVPSLTPGRAGHPWPPQLPPNWASGVYGRRDPVSYTRVEPELVVEILADVATDRGRYRHPVRVLRVRSDMNATEVAELNVAET